MRTTEVMEKLRKTYEQELRDLKLGRDLESKLKSLEEELCHLEKSCYRFAIAPTSPPAVVAWVNHYGSGAVEILWLERIYAAEPKDVGGCIYYPQTGWALYRKSTTKNGLEAEFRFWQGVFEALRRGQEEERR